MNHRHYDWKPLKMDGPTKVGGLQINILKFSERVLIVKALVV